MQASHYQVDKSNTKGHMEVWEGISLIPFFFFFKLKKVETVSDRGFFANIMLLQYSYKRKLNCLAIQNISKRVKH